MRRLEGTEEKEALKYLEEAAIIAKGASCLRAKCGSIIVKAGEIIGEGMNSPPGDREEQRRCDYDKKLLNEKITDKTCCVHAEQRAIMEALKNHPSKIKGSRIYFIRLGKNDEMTKAGKPYCTICSKMALDSGIKEFVLWHDEGITVHDTEEYNKLSYEYRKDINTTND